MADTAQRRQKSRRMRLFRCQRRNERVGATQQVNLGEEPGIKCVFDQRRDELVQGRHEACCEGECLVLWSLSRALMKLRSSSSVLVKRTAKTDRGCLTASSCCVGRFARVEATVDGVDALSKQWTTAFRCSWRRSHTTVLMPRKSRRERQEPDERVSHSVWQHHQSAA